MPSPFQEFMMAPSPLSFPMLMGTAFAGAGTVSLYLPPAPPAAEVNAPELAPCPVSIFEIVGAPLQDDATTGAPVRMDLEDFEDFNPGLLETGRRKGSSSPGVFPEVDFEY